MKTTHAAAAPRLPHARPAHGAHRTASNLARSCMLQLRAALGLSNGDAMTVPEVEAFSRQGGSVLNTSRLSNARHGARRGTQRKHYLRDGV
jgi:hypothetical protein